MNINRSNHEIFEAISNFVHIFPFQIFKCQLAKNYFWLFATLFMMNSSPTIGQALDQKDFKYYFFVNDQMYGIRDFYNVQTQLQAGELLEHDGLDTFSIHNLDKIISGEVRRI